MTDADRHASPMLDPEFDLGIQITIEHGADGSRTIHWLTRDGQSGSSTQTPAERGWPEPQTFEPGEPLPPDWQPQSLRV
jgi:hypothetical protein